MPAGTAAASIHAERVRSGRRLVVLDDDPTGSQTVHDVEIVTVFERAEYAAALAEPGSVCFVLTNTRGMPEADAVALNERVAADVFALVRELSAPIDVVSRGDSTLRGHVMAETAAIDRARSAALGAGYDGVLFAPAFFEAGRETEDDIHWLVGPEGRTPAGESEFARDATFGYRSSDLREFVAEVSGGAVPGGVVHSLALADIRSGPERVAEVLEGVRDGAFVVVNGTSYDDFTTVALGLLRAEAAGKSFLHRTGPSFVRALAGIDGTDPVGPAQIWPEGRGPGYGLVAVGSHVGRSSEQLEQLRAAGGFIEVELDVPTLVGGGERARDHFSDIRARMAAGLARSDVLLSTSRALVTGSDGGSSLAISVGVSHAVADLVRDVLDAHPAWIVAKGGITSHEIAVRGLGLRRAEVVGQFGRGIVSLFRPIAAEPRAIGIPYVVFPGNVGGPEMLATVVRMLRGEERR